MSDEYVSDAAAATTRMAADRQAGDERLAYRGVFQRMLTRPEIGAAIAALGIWVFFWSVSVPFGKAGGASSILDVASSPLGIMAVAVAMLMIGGEFDLSAGAATGALGILTILMVREVVGASGGGWGLSLWIALPLSLLAALGLGWFNGTVVEKTALPSFIVTLASFFVLKGAKLGYSKLILGQQQVGKLDDLQSVSAFLDDNGTSVTVFDPYGMEEVFIPDGQEAFQVVPPVIDIIEANLDAGADAFAGLDPSVFEQGDKGYGFMAGGTCKPCLGTSLRTCPPNTFRNTTCTPTTDFICAPLGTPCDPANNQWTIRNGSAWRSPAHPGAQWACGSCPPHSSNPWRPTGWRRPRLAR